MDPGSGDSRFGDFRYKNGFHGRQPDSRGSCDSSGKQDIQEKLSISGPVSGTDSVDVVSNIHAEILQMNVKERGIRL